MAKLLLNFIFTVVMTFCVRQYHVNTTCTDTIVKFFIDKNLECKFTNNFCLSDIACGRNKTDLHKKIEKNRDP